MLGNTGPQYVVLPHRAVPRRAASRRVASCREDRNGFYPRDAATRQRGTGLWGKAIYIVNLALLTIVDSLLAVSAFESRSAIAVVFKDTCVDAGCAVLTERLDGIDWMVAHTSWRGHTNIYTHCSFMQGHTLVYEKHDVWFKEMPAGVRVPKYS